MSLLLFSLSYHIYIYIKPQLVPLYLLMLQLLSLILASSGLSRCFFLLFIVTVSVVHVCPFRSSCSQAVVIIAYVSVTLGNIMITSILVWFL